MGAGMGMGGAGAIAGAAGSIQTQGGAIAGFIGDLLNDPAKAVAPKARRAEKKYRRSTKQIIAEARRVLEGGVGLQAELMGPALADLGFEFDTIDNREALTSALTDLESLSSERDQLRRQVRSRAGKKRKKARKKLQSRRRQLNREISALEQEVGRLQTNPLQVTNVRRAAPSEQDAVEDSIDAGIRSRLDAALTGEAPDDPRLLRQIAEGRDTLLEGLRRRLGSGYEGSTPGSQAIADYDQRSRETLADARRADTATFGDLFLRDVAQDEVLAASRQERTFAIPRERFSASEVLSRLGLVNVDAQSPYQFDRDQEFRASLANLGTPSAAATPFMALDRGLTRSGEDFKELGAALGAGGAAGGGGGGGGMGGLFGG